MTEPTSARVPAAPQTARTPWQGCVVGVVLGGVLRGVLLVLSTALMP